MDYFNLKILVAGLIFTIIDQLTRVKREPLWVLYGITYFLISYSVFPYFQA